MKAHLSIYYLIACCVLMACNRSDVPLVEESIRSVKTLTIDEQIGSMQQRHFSGLIQVVQVSMLSFEVSGRVTAVNVNIGDRVDKGQVLAMLDPESYQLRVQSSRADLNRAEADYLNLRRDFQRQQELSVDGRIPQAMVDEAKAATDAAKNTVAIARSQLSIAERDLKNTRLAAPFDGFISSRTVDPHVEISLGEELFRIDAEGDLEVEIRIPENLVSFVSMGTLGDVAFPSLPKVKLAAMVIEVGSRAAKESAIWSGILI